MSAARTPAVIDERIPRVIATATVLLAATVLATGWWPLLVPLAVDFSLRAAGRPGYSPLARLAKAVVRRRPSASAVRVAARPKQFAAGIGAAVSSAAALAVLGFGSTAVAVVLLGGLWAAALLEAAFGYCLGCRLYALLTSAGIITDACPECSNLRPARDAAPVRERVEA